MNTNNIEKVLSWGHFRNYKIQLDTHNYYVAKFYKEGNKKASRGKKICVYANDNENAYIIDESNKKKYSGCKIENFEDTLKLIIN